MKNQKKEYGERKAVWNSIRKKERKRKERIWRNKESEWKIKRKGM